MFRALEKIKKSSKGKLDDGKVIGGGKGRLTAGPHGVIVRLSELYRNAIRQNVQKVSITDKASIENGVEKMQHAILAILYHSVKLSDNKERHKYCPANTADEASWCKFRREGSMENNKYNLDPIFLDLLAPTFRRLSSPELLERCLAGYTQNQNESFNARIWNRCPKHMWRGNLRVQIAVNLSILQWNSGSNEGRESVMMHLGLAYTKHAQIAFQKLDAKCVRASLHRGSELQKRKRMTQAKNKAYIEDQKKKAEGTTYQNALFAGLTIDSDNSEWDSDDELPLGTNAQWDSDDDLPLASNVRSWDSDDDEPLATLINT